MEPPVECKGCGETATPYPAECPNCGEQRCPKCGAVETTETPGERGYGQHVHCADCGFMLAYE